MGAATVGYLEDGQQVRTALSPLRRRVLDLLREPASAAELGTRLDMPRQKINYHLGVLERAGLIELVETRPRRGCTERVMRATAADYVVDPQLMQPGAGVRSRDRYAAGHLVQTASGVVRDVSRMQAGADRAGQRLLTFTIEAEVRFAQPADVHAYTEALAEAIASVNAQFTAKDGQPYRVVVGGHPSPDQGEHQHG